MRGNPKSWFISLIALGLNLGASAIQSKAQPPAVLIARESTWKYTAGGARPPAGWTQASFDDSAWKSGAAGFGYGDADDRTVLADMRNRYTAVYIRKSFDLERLDSIDALYLYINYDDGFIAYLNGQRVASAAVREEAGGLVVDQHEAQGFEVFTIKNARALLRPGTNVLAIEGHNVGLDSSDFSLDPWLTTRKVSPLRVADYLADLDELERRLEDQSSYLTRLGFDHRAALAELRRSISDETDLARFAADVRKLVMRIGDSHARVESSAEPAPAAFLPIRPADTDRGIAALSVYVNRPLDGDCPYLESIDGEPLARWLDAASQFVPHGSPQLIRRRALEELGDVGLLRDELKLAANLTVTIGLRSADGSKRVTRRYRVLNQRYGVAEVRRLPPRVLEENVGYIPIPEMDDRLIESTVAAIKGLRDTTGLILDVRDNSGGTYGLMRAIYPLFVPAGAAPHVTNIAAYRLSTRFAPDHIAYRPTYRADWPGWDRAERAAIDRALADFHPEWTPPAGKFSAWHFMILSRKWSGREDDDFFYDRPVVVLSNAGSFSAADGFLNAFADLPQVTIVGEPSAGGSGATREFALPRSKVVVAVSSMASFRPSGKLFDGRGIEVDVAAKPTLDDFTSGADSVLARGLEVIRAKGR